MKRIPFALMFLLAGLPSAGADFSSSCIWDGEPHIQQAVIDQGQEWIAAVYQLYETGSAAPVEFEGVGSCRFIDRGLAAKAGDDIAAFEKIGFPITPTRAYLKYGGGKMKFVIPTANYAFVTNVLFVSKDFYSLENNDSCRQQVQDVIAFGQSTSSIDLRLSDVDFKSDADGLSAVINGQTTTGNLLGVCHFHAL